MNQIISEWVDTTVGEQCEVIAGQSPEGKFYNSTGIGLPFYQGKKEYGEKFIGAPKKWTSHTTKEGLAGDILMSVRAPVGPINFATQKICIGRGLAAIRAGDGIDKEFLYYYLLSKQNEISGNEGAVFASINKAQIESIRLLLPPLPEQKRIVAILDEAFSCINQAVANTEQNLANARELLESYLNNFFIQKGEGWDIKTLLDITSILGDGLHGTPKYSVDGEFYFVNGNNLNDGVITYKESTKRVSVEEYQKYKKELTDRTILVSINGTLGNVAFYNNEKIILGKSACYFNLVESVDKHYIKHIISSPYFLNYADKEATGVTIKNVSLKSMRKFEIPLPPLKEQQAITKKIGDLSAKTKKLEMIYQKKLTALTELRQSILQKAFAGELASDLALKQANG